MRASRQANTALASAVIGAYDDWTVIRAKKLTALCVCAVLPSVLVVVDCGSAATMPGTALGTFDVSGSATSGLRNVTVTNPDGQTASLTGAVERLT